MDKWEDNRRIQGRINQAIEEVVGVATSQSSLVYLPFTMEDQRSKKMWPSIKIRHGAWSDNLVSKKDHLCVIWEPPAEGWHNVNFDGVVQSNPRPSGVGIVIRNEKGDIIKCGAKRLKTDTNNEVEAYPTLLVVRLARSSGIKKLHLEGDSLVIIQTIKNGGINAWHLQGYISLIVGELNRFKNFMVSHIRREGNKVANKLSKWALSFE
ncbi:uncharacterized protein LOC131034983 [Cryptomeria japonica]|uniref:uncharacterized protein LOC131034983 n=1 Tax=Cryptomeria japonica TaxID=3369 RepID=UPI0025AD6A89|nr:uncharacterized protein LOC131034983 [Cryptomeria japonica]